MKKIIAILCVLSAGSMVQAQSPTHIDLAAPPNVVAPAAPVDGPTGCTVIYDAELGQARDEFFSAATGNANSGRVVFGELLDMLIADDFFADEPGRITDVWLYSINFLGGEPADGVRIYLWGTGEVPAEEPTLSLEIPADQVQITHLNWWDTYGLEFHVTGLDIPFEAGQNWITIQPRDETPEGDWYHSMGNRDLPLQGADAYVKDGPNGEGGYGFTDWHPLGDIFQPGDSYIRLESCEEPLALSISIVGDCGEWVYFYWRDAPPDEELTFVYAKNTGQIRIPGPMVCGGTELGLGARFIQQAFTVNTGSLGDGASRQFLPAAACPGYFQALIRGDGPCETSNVVPTP